MTFRSILFPGAPDWAARDPDGPPDFFRDLNLDQIVAAATAGKDEYNLKPFFYVPLHDSDAIAYRHEVMQALNNPRVLSILQAFAQSMRAMREQMAAAEKRYYTQQKERWFLDAMDLYCDAVTRLAHDLSLEEFESRGLLGLRDYLVAYTSSDRFTSLRQQTKELKANLASISYCVHVDSPHFRVSHCETESDYSADVQATFDRFRQGTVKDYKFQFSNSPDMNNVEAIILEFVSRLHPDIFSALRAYCANHKASVNHTVTTFDREIQFYISYREHMTRLEAAGLEFCYPRVVNGTKEVLNRRGFDLALAGKLVGEGVAPVCNDFHLRGCERIIVVSGPNQGGKTTFARTFGQLHYLASLGLPVPGREAQLFLFDRLLTHFEREEIATNLRGKLQDDLIRIHRILGQASPDSIVIMNEIFTSTALHDAIALSKRIAAKLMDLDLLCVWVTFIDELASLGEQTVSMVSTVNPADPAQRTYKIIRRAADGLSYAMSIAEKHRLTYGMIRERVGS